MMLCSSTHLKMATVVGVPDLTKQSCSGQKPNTADWSMCSGTVKKIQGRAKAPPFLFGLANLNADVFGFVGIFCVQFVLA